MTTDEEKKAQPSRKDCIRHGCRPSAWMEPDMPHVPGVIVQICLDCGRTINYCQQPVDENGKVI